MTIPNAIIASVPLPEPKLEVLRAPVIRSTGESQDEILLAIKRLHCPSGFDCDATFGAGAFWRKLPRPGLCFDITPMSEGVTQADCRLLPLASESLNSIVFDPPFLTYVKNGRDHKGGRVALTKRFGGFYSYTELEDMYRDSISEAYRVLKHRGRYVFKCQDIVHNHRLHCTHVRVIQMAEIEGFRLLDLFVLVARHRMPGPQKGQQRHARVFHSYFLVFEKK